MLTLLHIMIQIMLGCAGNYLPKPIFYDIYYDFHNAQLEAVRKSQSIVTV